MDCYCGSGKSFSTCCEPFHKGNAIPASPLALLRSRYSAYATGYHSFLLQTNHPETLSPDEIDYYSSGNTQWIRLEVVDSEIPGKDPDEAFVSFRAYFKTENLVSIHSEISRFLRLNGYWYYHSGIMRAFADKKTGRNQLCSCGSGKKSKKCCG